HGRPDALPHQHLPRPRPRPGRGGAGGPHVRRVLVRLPRAVRARRVDVPRAATWRAAGAGAGAGHGARDGAQPRVGRYIGGHGGRQRRGGRGRGRGGLLASNTACAESEAGGEGRDAGVYAGGV
ncbi:hypothetical protein FIBSPDRAFT_1051854, partial [Athelia psychrophila]